MAQNNLSAPGNSTLPGEADLEHAALEVLEELLLKMRIKAHVTAQWEPPSQPGETAALVLNVQGDDLSQLIGRRGETLAALQYITRVIVTKQVGELANVVVDVEGYKARREQQLRRLAQRMAEQAVAQGRTVVLEPMPPNERRLIHLALRDNPDVHTESVGEGEHRKVTIVPRR
jgi:spoIIIJ-associated protein